MEIQGSRVLLVEDNADDATFVSLAFKRAKLEEALVVVSSGDQAIDYLRGSGPYVDRDRFPLPFMLLLDLSMPGTDGFAVLKWVRQSPLWKRLPVTVFTGSDFHSDIDRAYELGANSYIVKPFRFDDFSNAVARIADFWLDCGRLPTLRASGCGT